MFVLALVGAGVAESQTDGFVGFTFFVVLIGGYLLDTRERYEWMTMLVFAGVGVHSAFDIAAAAAVDGYLPNTYEFTGGQSYDVSTFQETALGFVFFTWFTVFPIIGLLVGVAGRGVLNPAVTRDGFPTILSNQVGIVKHYRCKSPSLFGLQLTWPRLAFRSRKRRRPPTPWWPRWR